MKLDKLGRLCIPRKFRKEVDLRVGDCVALFPDSVESSIRMGIISPERKGAYILVAEVKSENRLQIPKHVRNYLGWEPDTEVIWERIPLTYDLVVKRA